MCDSWDLTEDREKKMQYQVVFTQNAELPVNVNFRRSNSGSGGCILHWHEALEFYYVIRGGVSLLHNGRIDWLNPGDVGFVNWCEPHRGNGFLDGTEHYIIQIGTELFGDEVISSVSAGTSQKRNLLLTLISQKDKIPGVFRNCPELTGLMDIMVQEAGEKQAGFELKIKAAVWNILVLLLRKIEDDDGNNPSGTKDLTSLEHLKKVLAYISLHCTEPEKVSLEALGKQFGLSVPYLCRLFKKYTTLTLTTYVNELRCSRAASYIQNGMRLEEAAKRTGFRDYNYFSRLFKKVMGISPSSCRDRM